MYTYKNCICNSIILCNYILASVQFNGVPVLPILVKNFDESNCSKHRKNHLLNGLIAKNKEIKKKKKTF